MLFHLTHGLDNGSKDQLVNPSRYGSRTWFDAARHKFAMFDAIQARMIASYLQHRADSADIEAPERRSAREALDNYWLRRS